MSHCLHCGKPCLDQAVFCEECQEQARELFQQEQPEQFPFSAGFSPLTPAAFSSGEEDGQPLGTLTMPFEPPDPFAEVSTLSSDGGLSSTDQAVSRLSAAARWIEAEEPGESRLRRASRLTPLRDISADIQRASTPHPLLKRHTDFDTLPGSGAGQLSSSAHEAQAAAAWPWFESEEEEKENDLWANFTDPLLARSRPTHGEAAPIEEADIRRVQLEEHETLLYPVIQPRKARLSRWHTAFASMVIVAVLALVVDGLLLSFAFHHAGRSNTPQGGPPTLLLSTNIANPGDSISLHLTHFIQSTRVALTHDVQETLVTTGNLSTLTIDTNGSASATFSVNAAWGPGFHLIVAEDVTTRDTASAMLQIAGEGPSRPPHLMVDTGSLDLGDAVQGANTIQPLELRNSGSGSISWSASSDQPWLQVAPVQGVFSAGQSISIAVQRNNLAPGAYSGTIMIFSTVGAPQTIQVSMKVSALPPNAGPMISLTPPLLAFTATDGSTQSGQQVMTLSNPGQQALDWFLNIGPTTPMTTQVQGTAQGDTSLSNQTPWLSTDVNSGRLAPGASLRIRVTASGQNLLPGAYMVPLTFSSTQKMGAYDNPQVMNVTLTVQPRCGLLTSNGVLDFTAVAGQSNPSHHPLGLSTTSSCGNETLNWHALSSAPWLTTNPQSGELKGTSGGVTSIGVNTTGLAAGKYTGLVTFQAGKSTQTVVVHLNLQPHPSALEPILGVSPLSLNFSTIQGQMSPAGQVVTITNNGGSALKWHTSVVQLGTNWLSALPTGGTVAPGETGQATVAVTTTTLTPGSYTGQILLSATDARGAPASGSAQTVTVSLTVQPPCTLAQPSSSSLLFTATAGAPNPLVQTVNLTSTGSCSWPIHWSTSVSPAAPWLTLSASAGSLTALGQQSSLSVGVNASGLPPGTYSTQVKISAIDSAGMSANRSPQTFSVTLTVQQPCTLQTLPAQIVLTAVAGQAATAQSLTIGSTGSCDGGISWTAIGDANSGSWLGLSSTAGTNNGSGSTVAVNASASQLTPGTYTGQITVSANNNGMVLQGSPQTVKVTFQVSGYIVSGTALACSGPIPTCATSQGLAGATISLVNSSNITIATVTADSSGDFTLTNVPPGTYTISATGSTDAVNYSGTVTVTVNSSQNGINLQTFAP